MVAERDRAVILVVDSWGSVNRALFNSDAYVIEADDKSELHELWPYIDGVVLTGGNDINPDRYGAESHPKTQSPVITRDNLDFLAAKMALRDRIPIMGICRGHQVLNVAHGGSLIQHLDDLKAVHNHGYTEHWVKVRSKSRIGRAIKVGQFQATSLHHQAVERLGDGLVPVGWTSDGVVEMFESAPGVRPYVLGCQFHPEMNYDTDRAAEAIFDYFVSVAAGRTSLDNVEERVNTLRRKKKAKHVAYDYRKSQSSTALPGHAGSQFETDEYNRWWPASRYEDDDDLADYESWLHINAKDIEAIAKSVNDDLCEFPPCPTEYECGQWNDCMASAVAKQNSTKALCKVTDINKHKRGNPRKEGG